MATFLVVLALMPMFYAVMVTGDFSQFVYKPTLKEVYFILKNRWIIIGVSDLLWLAGLAWHLFVTPTQTWVLVVTGILMIIFFNMGFMMSPYVLFVPVRNPKMISAQEADTHLSPDELVIALNVNGDARAYPIRWILRPHMVVDQVGGEEAIITYCMLCNSAMTYKPELSGEKLNFITPLQWENNMMFYDPYSGHLVQQITGEIVDGPEAGKFLSNIPTRIVPWSTWKQLHPETKVLHHPPVNGIDKFVRMMFTKQIFEPNFMQEPPIFPTITKFDKRLPNKELVFGVNVDGTSKAYALKTIKETPVMNDMVNGVPLLVAYDPERDVVDVFSREVDGKTLTFELGSVAGTFRDQETGSEWNITGRAISGEFANKSLTPLPHFSRVLWFSWANFFPKTELA